MKFRKPDHRIDAPIIFVHPADEAWDTEALNKSFKEHGKDCPWLVYCTGQSRFDLGPVQHFLKGSPVEFHGRRLDAIELNEITALWEREAVQGFPRARASVLKSLRLCLTKVERDGTSLVDLERPGDLTNADVQTLTDSFDEGIEVLRLVGNAFFQASKPLSDAEKKR